MESQYLDLLRDLLGAPARATRAGAARATFGRVLQADLRAEFPLLTTKRMFWRGIVEELLFFLRGETDTRLLEAKGVNIWRHNTRRETLDELGLEEYEEGIMGPMYGFQWRSFGAPMDPQTGRPDGTGFDQLNYLLETLRVDPTSRRLLMTTFNPAVAARGVLYPCHSLILQCFVDGEWLDMTVYNRSADAFLGLPFNMASAALLLHILARACGRTARHLTLFLGDVHLYCEHEEAARAQLDRLPREAPRLRIAKHAPIAPDKYLYEDFILENYDAAPAIKAKCL